MLKKGKRRNSDKISKLFEDYIDNEQLSLRRERKRLVAALSAEQYRLTARIQMFGTLEKLIRENGRFFSAFDPLPPMPSRFLGKAAG